ncbi:MAG: pentapeptide repeat-containing protein [Oscillatoriaceae cyanobacterium Prado104]|jgi:uncharacterized protein YjbI with pentapeptide repeats|nr:pentapeptide repeat-containing protein [Oscillatoriaceae cyanobacterium Prado104]
MKKLTILSVALLIFGATAATLEYPQLGLQQRAIGQQNNPQPTQDDPKKLGYVSPEFAEKLSQDQIDQINANVETLLITQSCLRCDLRAVNLINIRLKNAILTGADLSDANLSRSTFEIADFVNTNLARTNLSEAVLVGARISNTNLRKANLTGTNLDGADLRFSDLRDADLTNANLRNANIDGASLDRASMGGTIMPDGRKNQ